MLCQLVASDISLATSFSFHSKTHRALILLLLASKPDPLLLGSGLGPPLRGSFFLSQGNIDFNRLQMDITQAPAFLKAALPSGCGCDVEMKSRRAKVQCTLALRLFCTCAPSFCSVPSLVGRSSQAMRALIPTHHLCLCPRSPLNAEFYSAVARSANALKGDAKTPTPLLVIEQIIPS